MPLPASPPTYTAEQTAQTIAALDRKALLSLGSVPPDGRVTVAQAATSSTLAPRVYTSR